MEIRVLVLADIDHRIELEFPELVFDYMGYALPEHIPSTHDEIRERIGRYDILISEFDVIDSDIMDAAERLRMIICCRGGARTVIDMSYAAKKGILVRSMPARNASSVVEYVLGVIFNADRQLMRANELVRNDTLQQQTFILPEHYRDSLWGMDRNSPYHTLRGKGIHNLSLGVIGYGNIGRAVVNAAVLLGIRTMVYDHHRIMSPIPAGAEVVGFEELLRNADYVSLHCNNRTHETLMGETEFAQMKEGAYFINTARGDLVDEDALIRTLQDGHLRGAAIDVTRTEPLPPESPLIRVGNLFITPHIAGAADEVVQTGTDMAIYYLREYLADIWETEDE